MTSQVDTATDADRFFFFYYYYYSRPRVELAKWPSNKLVSAQEKKTKKPFSITEPIKDEVKIKERNMGKI